MADDRGEVTVSVPDNGNGYALGGKIMLSAVVVLFAVVVFMVGFHLYARWYLLRLRRRQLERRRQRRSGRTHVVLYTTTNNNNNHPVSGLDPTVLNSLPVFLFSGHKEEEMMPVVECAVCLSEFEENEVVRLLPKCNHSFHIECIDMWFHSHSTCPLCRSAVERVVEPVVAEPAGLEQLCASCRIEKGDIETGTGTGTGTSTTSSSSAKVGVRIEVPSRRSESGGELSLSSPASRILSIKRILSMGRKSPSGAGTSSGTQELDLESGLDESGTSRSRVQTPR